jgi:hypothetical protein
MSYNDDPQPGSETYANAYWSSPEGRRRSAEIDAVKNPPPPPLREKIGAALAAHDKALHDRQWTSDGRSRQRDPGPQPGELTDAALADIQRALVVLDGDPFESAADKPSSGPEYDLIAGQIADLGGAE